MLSILRCCGNKIQPVTFTKNFYRNYMKVSEKMEMLIKKADNVPRGYELVYRNKDNATASFMHHFVNFSACAFLGVAGVYVYNNGFVLPNIDEKEEHEDYFKNSFEFFISFISIFITVGLAAAMRHRYTIRVYFNPKTNMFRAIFIGKIPFTREFYEFPANTLTYVAKDSILPWKSSLFISNNNRKLMLYEEKFRTMADFHNMLRPEEIII